MCCAVTDCYDQMEFLDTKQIEIFSHGHGHMISPSFTDREIGIKDGRLSRTH